jgi:hypothetical protein
MPQMQACAECCQATLTLTLPPTQRAHPVSPLFLVLHLHERHPEIASLRVLGVGEVENRLHIVGAREVDLHDLRDLHDLCARHVGEEFLYLAGGLDLHGTLPSTKELCLRPAMGHTLLVGIEQIDGLREPLEEVLLAGHHITRHLNTKTQDW